MRYNNNHNGLNGLFGRLLKKAINKVAAFADSVLDRVTFGIAKEIVVIQDFTADIGEGGAGFWNRTTGGLPFNENYEATANEEIILERFVDNFKLIVVNLTQYAESINANPNVATKIQMLNYLHQRIGVIIYYYRNNELVGLSNNAVALREAIMQPFFDVIVKIPSGKITQGLFQSEITVMVNSGTDIPEFSPIPTLTKSSFSAKYIVFKTSNEVSNPKDNIVIENPKDNNQVIDNNNNNNSNSNTSEPTKKKSNWRWLWIPVGIVVGREILKDK